MRYKAVIKRSQNVTETLAGFKYYHDATMFLRWRLDARNIFDENGTEGYNPNAGLYTPEGDFALFNSPSAILADINDHSDIHLTKRDVAKRVLGANAVFDYAIPSTWADLVVKNCEEVFEYERYELYAILSGGVVWYYPLSSVFGTPAALTKQALALLLWSYAGEK